MNRPLKILMLEDSVTDAEIIQRMLKKELPSPEFYLAMDKPSFLKALHEFLPDLILADNSLPQLNSAEALALAREHHPFVPFILVTGTVSEEFAASIIKQGADDYILKDRLGRLPAAIDGSIKQRKAEKELRDYKYALDASSIVAITDEKGIILYANDNFCRISKYTAEELVGQNHRIINSGYHPKSYFKNFWETISSGKIWRGEFCNRAKDRSLYWVEATVIPFLNEHGRPYQYLSIRTDITERKKVEEELKKSHEELRQLASYLQKVREDERTSIAREIHDELGQQLTVMKIDVSWLSKKVNNADKEFLQKTKEVLNMLDETMKTIRRIASELRPSMLDDMGLHPAIENYLSEFERKTGVKTELKVFQTELDLPDMVKTGLFRIMQESLTNVSRYARAKNVWVELNLENDRLVLSIRDDGAGFDRESISGKKTLGLLGMKERSAMMGGSYEIHSSPGQGTTVIVTVPIEPNPSHQFSQ